MIYPILKRIEVVTPLPNLVQVAYNQDYWRLESQYYRAKFHTNEGTWDLILLHGWITDKRSGSDAINWLVPKDGNPEYRACVFAHDTAWSGRMSRALSNDLFIRQGFAMSNEVSQPIANLSKFTVDHFGRYYDFNEPLPPPYENNRQLESLILVHK